MNGFQAARGLTVSGKLDAATWSALNADAAPALVAYTLTAEDVTGPYVEIPEDMMAKSELKSLGYESIGEALGERFHTSPELLKRLSPDTDFSKADAVLHVPRTVGKTQSHGCVRLSNWDVLAVAAALDTSVPVVMQE